MAHRADFNTLTSAQRTQLVNLILGIPPALLELSRSHSDADLRMVLLRARSRRTEDW